MGIGIEGNQLTTGIEPQLNGLRDGLETIAGGNGHGRLDGLRQAWNSEFQKRNPIAVDDPNRLAQQVFLAAVSTTEAEAVAQGIPIVISEQAVERETLHGAVVQ